MYSICEQVELNCLMTSINPYPYLAEAWRISGARKDENNWILESDSHDFVYNEQTIRSKLDQRLYLNEPKISFFVIVQTDQQQPREFLHSSIEWAQDGAKILVTYNRFFDLSDEPDIFPKLGDVHSSQTPTSNHLTQNFTTSYNGLRAVIDEKWALCQAQYYFALYVWIESNEVGAVRQAIRNWVEEHEFEEVEDEPWTFEQTATFTFTLPKTHQIDITSRVKKVRVLPFEGVASPPSFILLLLVRKLPNQAWIPCGEVQYNVRKIKSSKLRSTSEFMSLLLFDTDRRTVKRDFSTEPFSLTATIEAWNRVYNALVGKVFTKILQLGDVREMVHGLRYFLPRGGGSKKPKSSDSCIVCSRASLDECPKCKTPYCSRLCQNIDWHVNRHAAICSV